jgi:hypothetical protein
MARALALSQDSLDVGLVHGVILVVVEDPRPVAQPRGIVAGSAGAWQPISLRPPVAIVWGLDRFELGAIALPCCSRPLSATVLSLGAFRGLVVRVQLGVCSRTPVSVVKRDVTRFCDGADVGVLHTYGCLIFLPSELSALGGATTTRERHQRSVIPAAAGTALDS